MMHEPREILGMIFEGGAPALLIIHSLQPGCFGGGICEWFELVKYLSWVRLIVQVFSFSFFFGSQMNSEIKV